MVIGAVALARLDPGSQHPCAYESTDMCIYYTQLQIIIKQKSHLLLMRKKDILSTRNTKGPGLLITHQ